MIQPMFQDQRRTLLGVRRQFEPEAASLTRSTFNSYAPSHSFCSLASDRKTKARPGKLLFAVEPLEYAEQFGLVLRSDADAIILNGDTNVMPSGFSIDANHRFGRRADELERVRDEIRQDEQDGRWMSECLRH